MVALGANCTPYYTMKGFNALCQNNFHVQERKFNLILETYIACTLKLFVSLYVCICLLFI